MLECFSDNANEWRPTCVMCEDEAERKHPASGRLHIQSVECSSELASAWVHLSAGHFLELQDASCGWMDGWMHGWMDGRMDGLFQPSLTHCAFQSMTLHSRRKSSHSSYSLKCKTELKLTIQSLSRTRESRNTVSFSDRCPGPQKGAAKLFLCQWEVGGLQNGAKVRSASYTPSFKFKGDGNLMNS